jgi:hypothetical protein
MVIKKNLSKAPKKAPKKAPAKKSVRKTPQKSDKKKLELDYSLPHKFSLPFFPNKTWVLAGKAESCSFDLVGLRSILNLVAADSELNPNNEALYVVTRELERVEKELIKLSDDLYALAREEKAKK